MADYSKEDFKAECDRRRNENLIVKGNTYPIKDQIKELGGIWDSRQKQWLMPDESAVAECNVALGLGDGPPPDRDTNAESKEEEEDSDLPF
jgi:hypothetical protein